MALLFPLDGFFFSEVALTLRIVQMFEYIIGILMIYLLFHDISHYAALLKMASVSTRC